MHPMVAAMRAAAEKAAASGKGPTPATKSASIESQTRIATALLDEGRAFIWQRGGSLSPYNGERAFYLEVGYTVSNAEDHWTDIDKRLAEAYYESRTFADFIGAGIMEGEDLG